MDIAIASGKGGTGKTTFALALAAWCGPRRDGVALIDCDVEEPNVNLFLKAEISDEKKVNVLIPQVNGDICTGRGECGDFCEFSAIVLMKGKPVVIPEMCHSCGGCSLVCPERAIVEVPKETGTVFSGRARGIDYAGGLLKIGEPMSPPVIKETKKYFTNAEIRIIDCPPGTSCPVIESVRGSDYVVLVTEPTPFGLNDLRLAVEMCRALDLPFCVVINRDGTGDDRVREYCGDENILIPASIPFSRKLAEDYARGDAAGYLIENHASELESIMNHILENQKKVCVT